MFVRDCIFLPTFIHATLLLMIHAAPTTSSVQSSLWTGHRNSKHLPFQLSGLRNSTFLFEDPGESYHVPHTFTTLYFDLGFPADANSISSTIKSARKLCDFYVDSGSGEKIPHDRDEDSFREDLGYGVRLFCYVHQ